MDENDTNSSLLSIQLQHGKLNIRLPGIKCFFSFSVKWKDYLSYLKLHVLNAETYTFMVTYLDVYEIVKKC